MADFTTSSHRVPAAPYTYSDFHTPPDIPSPAQNTVFPVPESLTPTTWPRLPLRHDSNIDSVARPQLRFEQNKKRQVESAGEPRGGSFPTSSSKKPRAFKRPKKAVREIPGFACPLYKHNPSDFGGPRGCADWCTLEIHRLYSVGRPITSIVTYTGPILTSTQDHLKKHAKEGDISYETLDAVKKLKPYVKDVIPEAKAAERWSLTYRYLHKLSFGDKTPSPYYQRPEESFERPSQNLTAGPGSSELSRHEPEQQDLISHLSSSHAPDQVAFHSNRSPFQPQHLPDMQAEHQSSTRIAERGFEAAAPLLLDWGAAIDAQDTDGRTALIRVVGAGDQGTARLLLELGAAVNAQDTEGITPLLLAVLCQHEEVVKLLLEWGPAINVQDDFGRTPLLLAVKEGYGEVVKLLLASNGVNPDFKDKEARTPLLWAAVQGHTAVVRLLLGSSGVSPDSKDYFSRTPLSWAAEKGYIEVVKLLLASTGVNPDSKDVLGRTPLSLAAAGGYGEVVKLLLASKAVNPDSKDDFGQTPLSIAAAGGCVEVVKLLLASNGVDPDSKDDLDRTPLLWATEKGCIEVVGLLLASNGVNPDSKDNLGQTPLLLAAEKGHGAVVQLLLASNGVNHPIA